MIHLIHTIYITIFLVYFFNFNKFTRSQITLIILLAYLLLPGRFKILSVNDIYFYKVYVLFFLSPIIISELKKIIIYKVYDKQFILILIPLIYLFKYYFFPESQLMNNSKNIIFKNSILDLINFLIFGIFVFSIDNKEINYLKKNFLKIITLFSLIVILEYGLFILFKYEFLDITKSVYDHKNNTFNSIFFKSYFITSFFVSISILINTYLFFITKKNYYILLNIFLLLIILQNSESRAIIISLLFSLIFLISIFFRKKNILIKFFIVIIAFIPIKIFYDKEFCTTLENKVIFKFSKNICDTESLKYRKIYFTREIEIFVNKLPFGVGPGVGNYYMQKQNVTPFIYVNFTDHDKNKSLLEREIYADILANNHENYNLTPPQPSNLYISILMSYGLIGLIVFGYLILWLIKNYYVFYSRSNLIYSSSVIFFVTNGIFNSTTGLSIIILIMVKILTYKKIASV